MGAKRLGMAELIVLGFKERQKKCRGLAGLAADIGQLDRARDLCSDAVATFRQLGDNRGLADELELLGRIATQDGDDPGAAAASPNVCSCVRY